MHTIDVTSLARSVIDGIGTVGPLFLVFATLGTMTLLLRPSGRQALLLAHHGFLGGRRHWWRRVVAGLAIPLLAVTSISVSLALEREIRDGSNRMLQEITGSAHTNAHWLLQVDTDHFMNTSRLPPPIAAQASHIAGTEVVWSQLSDVVSQDGSRTTSLILAKLAAPGMPPPRYGVQQAGARCQVDSWGCSPLPGQAIVDADLAPIGARLILRGDVLRVVAHFRTPASLLNRAVIAVNPSSFGRSGMEAAPYAVVGVTKHATAALEALVHRVGDSKSLEVRTTSAIEAANRRFWAGNGTPLVMTLILLIVAFATVAYFASRRAAQEQARSSLATLLAIGVKPRIMMQAEVARAWMSALVAGAIATPVSILIVRLADSQILGFHAQVNAVMVLSSMGLSIAVGYVAALLLYPRLLRLDIPAALNI